ncbi:hypothetical protein THAOC_09104 [Thalassiosira oceanica]|uniref:CTP synthase (glutamine hydrolyzing) n=1 Tax=Thalassiosira oceanica TaxID=159749 RepID=K0T8E6_THAOC|nr:hypothetical protein THAOC_09104 [Thalassiosira oceanica]|eukprot:EJK69621.1 hypothetical protein THAOC_09104 [Thalassiosira oceanica]
MTRPPKPSSKVVEERAPMQIAMTSLTSILRPGNSKVGAWTIPQHSVATNAAASDGRQARTRYTPNEVHRRHRRRRLRPRQGRDNLVHGADAPGVRPPGDVHQDRPVPQRRRRDDEPVRARRDVRAQRRRRDGPRPGQLRAVPLDLAHERSQHHDGQGVPEGHREGAAGGLPRQDGAGGAAHHERDTGLDRGGGERAGGRQRREALGRRGGRRDLHDGVRSERRHPGGRRLPHRGGGDRGRHRELGLPRGAAPVPVPRRAGKLLPDLRVAGPGYGGGAEDEADAARRARPAERRPEPHGDILQVQGGTRTIHEEQDRELLPRRRARLRAVRARREQRLPRPAPAARAAASPHPGGESQARVEEKSSMWNLCGGSAANENVLDALATGRGELDGLSGMSRSMVDWTRMAFKLDLFGESVRIVIVGKYTGLQDSYLSVIKSLKVSFSFTFLARCDVRAAKRSLLTSISSAQHASMAVERKLDLIWVEAAHLENDFDKEEMGGEKEYKEAWDKMKSADGVVVPGGFGTR